MEVWLEQVLPLRQDTGEEIIKIICVEKANIDRSGAVAQGLYAINCYMGMQWGENMPEDHVRYARNDLMGSCKRRFRL